MISADRSGIVWLTPAGEALHGAPRRWPMPTRTEDGEWEAGAPVAGEARVGLRGVHLLRVRDLYRRMGGTPFLVHYRGEHVEVADGLLVEEAWTVRPLAWSSEERRHFAIDCAARGLEQRRDRSVELQDALHLGRRFCRGEVSRTALSAIEAGLRQSYERCCGELDAAEGWLDAFPSSLDEERRVWRHTSEALQAQSVICAVSLDEDLVDLGADAAADAIVAFTGTTLRTVGSFGAVCQPVRETERRWMATQKWSYLNGDRRADAGPRYLAGRGGSPLTRQS